MAQLFPKPLDKYPILDLEDTDLELPEHVVNNTMSGRARNSSLFLRVFVPHACRSRTARRSWWFFLVLCASVPLW